MPARLAARSDKCNGLKLFYHICCYCSKVAAVSRLIAHFYRPGAMHKTSKSQLAMLLNSTCHCCCAALQVASLSEPLEMLPAVTATNLKFDLFDCLQMT